MNMLVLGGDARSAYLSQLAAENGWRVQTRYLELFEEALPQMQMDGQYDVVVLPYPVCEKDGLLFTPFCGRQVSMREVLPETAKARCVSGGRGARLWVVGAFDPGEDKGFVMENAEITAEGAVFCAMRDGKGEIMRSRCVILGCGRIARFLAHKLDHLGADVAIAARKAADRAYARASGWQAISFDIQELGDALAQAAFIFNTVPQPVLDQKLLARIPAKATLYELASAPYGFSMEEALHMGINARLESGLPGKYAPYAAAQAMLHLIERRVKEAEAHA